MRRFASLLMLGATACTGPLLDERADGSSGAAPRASLPGAGGSQPQAGGNCANATRLPRIVRTLNAVQYENSIRAVLPDAKLKDVFGVSDRSGEFSTSAQIRRFDSNAARLVMQNADSAAATAKASLSARFPCLSGSVDSPCVKQVAEGLGRDLFHEPPAADTVAKLVGLFERNQPAGANEAVQLVVSAMLSSPRFLFRKEVGQVTSQPGVFALTSHEVASSLAYALTDAPPDAALRVAADADALRDAEHVRAEVQRLLSSEHGLDGEQSFLSELYGARNFMLTDKDAQVFPLLDQPTRDDLLADFRDTVALTLRSPTPTLAELLTTRNLVVRPRAAALLGWTFPGLGPSGTVVTSSEPGRVGILTHPVIMATLAHQVESNPVARGHLVSGKVLCLDIPPPPQAVMFPIRSKGGAPRTLRQVLETEHAVGSCTGCHQLMDPLGYPFEVFDAIGKVRTTDADLPIDSTGTIPAATEIGGPVANVEDLMTRIASSGTARACFARSTVRYMAGVGDGVVATCAAQALTQRFGEQQGSIPELLSSLLSSETFMGRIEAQ